MKKATSFTLFLANVLILLAVVMISQNLSSRDLAANNAAANRIDTQDVALGQISDVAVADTTDSGFEGILVNQDELSAVENFVAGNMTPITIGLVSLTLITGGVFLFSLIKPHRESYDLAKKYKYAD